MKTSLWLLAVVFAACVGSIAGSQRFGKIVCDGLEIRSPESKYSAQILAQKDGVYVFLNDGKSGKSGDDRGVGIYLNDQGPAIGCWAKPMSGNRGYDVALSANADGGYVQVIDGKRIRMFDGKTVDAFAKLKPSAE